VRLAAGDVDGDGTDDLAVTAGTRTDLLLGAAGGLDTSAAQQIVKTVVPGVSDESLSSVLGDFDGDGRADLAVASPTAHVATVYPGGADGLDETRVRTFSPGSGGVPGRIDQEGFGVALAAGDFDTDGSDELVLGGQGSVWILRGSAAGTTAAGAALLTPAAVGTAAAADSGFGRALAVGAYDGGLGEDLLVTDPRGVRGAGSVTELFGAPSGLQRSGALVIVEGSKGVPGRPAPGDDFGVLPR
jgi:hypothetical protein